MKNKIPQILIVLILGIYSISIQATIIIYNMSGLDVITSIRFPNNLFGSRIAVPVFAGQSADFIRSVNINDYCRYTVPNGKNFIENPFADCSDLQASKDLSLVGANIDIRALLGKEDYANINIANCHIGKVTEFKHNKLTIVIHNLNKKNWGIFVKNTSVKKKKKVPKKQKIKNNENKLKDKFNSSEKEHKKTSTIDNETPYWF
ncbi:MAG: hypothetical protein HRT87_02775 [Legionellales bacterium]|nr:hypothetical protein [Legionellales bacterium]